ncbi:rhomboid family intramembrane serine protease [Alteribacillus sp. HJP-4]|uniref:rhomboid family intramembrane serine protease n=1 Tax=Alteribacillus sp. HJP-4 TaxID=2775394 RepID=UPI0035CD1918
MMMANHLYWKIVFHLVINEDFRILERSTDKKQIWLLKDNGGQRSVVRVARMEHIWLRDALKDKEQAELSFRSLKQRLALRKAPFYNIYVTSYPPVNMDETFKQTSDKKNKNIVYTFLTSIKGATEAVNTPQEIFQALGIRINWFPIAEMEEEQHQEKINEYRTAVKRRQEASEQQDRSHFMNGKPILTTILLASILFVFLLVEQSGSSTNIITLIEFGAKYNPAILEGEWWRLFSAMFLHIGMLHLVMNSLALFYLGGAVERMYGTARFLFIYAAAGLFGSLASFAFNDQVSAGASGAIFGCFGALLYFGVIHKDLFFRTMGMNVLFILGLNLAFGFTIPAIDNGAHIGGLAGGFLASSFVHLPKHGFSKLQIPTLLVLIGCAGGLTWFGFENENKASSPLMDAQIAQEWLERGEDERADELITAALEDNPDQPQLHFLKGYISTNENDYEAAAVSFERAVELNEDFAEAHYNLALVYIELGKIEEAEASLEQSKETGKENEELDFNHIEELLEDAGT